MTAATPSPLSVSTGRSSLRLLHVAVVLVCFLVAFLDGFDVQMISVVAPAIGREWQVSKEMFCLIFSSGLAGMLIGMSAQGPLSDRFGRKPVALICVAVFGLCTLACAFSRSAEQLLVLRFVGGIGMGAVLPTVIVLVSEIAPSNLRSRMVVLLGAGFPAGGLAAGAFCAWLLPVTGWRPIFMIGGVVPLLLVPVLARWMPESPLFLLDRSKRRAGAAREADLDRLNDFVRRGWSLPEEAEKPIAVHGVTALFGTEFRRSTILFWLIFAFNMMLFYSVLSWMPLILTSAGVPEHLAALSGATLNLGVIVGSFPLGWAADRYGPGRVLAMAFTAGAGLFCATGFLLGGSFGVLLAMCALLGAASGGSQLLLSAFAAAYYPTGLRATGVGFAGVAGRAGAIAGPAACGFLLAVGLGEGKLLALLAVPALLAALACTRFRPQLNDRRH